MVVAGFWVSHHAFFDRVRFIDRTMTWLNIFGLLFIALIPFSADLADTFVNYPIAAMVLELNILVVGAIFYVQWKYASKWSGELAESGMDDADVAAIDGRMLILPVVSILALGIAAAGMNWSTVLFWLIPVGYLTIGRRV